MKGHTMILKKAAQRFAVAALATAAVMAGVSAPAAQAGPTKHFILFANKSVIMRVCATARDSSERQVGHTCQTRAAGQKFVYWVPNNATKTRFTISDRGTQMLGADLANNRNYCYRAPASGHGRVTGPHNPCTPN